MRTSAKAYRTNSSPITGCCPRWHIQNSASTALQNTTMLSVTILAANPSSGVKAQGETSAISSFTCHDNRPDERMYPMRPITHVKAPARAEQHHHASNRNLAPLHRAVDERSFEHGTIDQQAGDDDGQRRDRLRRREPHTQFSGQIKAVDRQPDHIRPAPRQRASRSGCCRS